MPKIVKNGVEYCSTSSLGNANEILYDNSQSRLISETVQSAISELSEKNSVDVVDNLESTSTNLPLSANQGRVLNNRINEVFQLGTNRKAQVVGSLVNTNLGLTENSTWEEIVQGLYSLFPDTLNLLTYFTINNWKVSYNTDDGYQDIYANSSRVQFKIGVDQGSENKLTVISDDINISNFKTFTHTTGNAGDKASANTVKGSYTAQLICSDGTTYDIAGSGTKDISAKTGTAYIKLTATSGWISAARGFTNCGVYATVLRFDA